MLETTRLLSNPRRAVPVAASYLSSTQSALAKFDTGAHYVPRIRGSSASRSPWRSGRPRAPAQTCRNRGSRCPSGGRARAPWFFARMSRDWRFVDEELLHPLEVAHVEGLPEPEGFADLGAHLGRDGERELPGRVVGGEIEEREYDEADRDEGGDREEQAADDVADHGGGGIGREPPPSLRLRCASARGVGR